MIHYTRGVYPNGQFKNNGVESKNIASHIWYNMSLRPGRALFVDGICLYEGINVSKELLDKHEKELEGKLATVDTAPYQ